MLSRLLVFVGLALASCNVWAADRQAYRLGSGDEIRIVVLDSPQHSGSFQVADDGAIAFVSAGRLKVEGLTIPEATDAIRKAISDRVVDPAVSVEVARYRPFYILGDVTTPGAFPASPGLTVIQAVALAGGFKPRGDFLQSAVSGIRAAESLASARLQIVEARVRLARVEAEIGGRTTFDLPSDAELANGSARLADIVASERKVLNVRITGFAKQFELLERELRFRADELQALEARRASQQRESAQLKIELAEVQGLVSKGLAPTMRLNALNRDEIRNQGDILQTNIYILNSRQARNQAELAVSTIQRDRMLQLMAEEQEQTGRLKRLRIQIGADEAVVLEAAGEGRQLASPRTKFTVTRKGNDVAHADDNLAIEPGDVIRIDRRESAAISQ